MSPHPEHRDHDGDTAGRSTGSPPLAPLGGVAVSRVAVASGGTRRWVAAFVAVLLVVAGLGLVGRLGASAAPASAAAVPTASAVTGSSASPGAGSAGGSASSADSGRDGPAAVPVRAELTVPAAGSEWTDLAGIPVAGTATGDLSGIHVTVTVSHLVIGERTLPVGAEGRFSGLVEIVPPPDRQRAEIRLLEPGPSARNLAIVPVTVGTSLQMLVAATVTVPGTHGGAAVRLSGIARRDVSGVSARLETAFGPSRAVAATLGPPGSPVIFDPGVSGDTSGGSSASASGSSASATASAAGSSSASSVATSAATAYLARWRAFRATVQLPPGMGCGDGSLTVTATIGTAVETETIPLCVAR